MLIKRPGVTLIAVITLGLGIGASTLVFSGVYALMLAGLPYPNADRIVVISRANRQGDEFGVSYALFSSWKSENTAFEQMAASRTSGLNLAEGAEVERVTVRSVSPEFFPLLDGQALVGRIFKEEAFKAGGDKQVLLSHGFWQRRFGADGSVIGRQIRLDDHDYTVIGVMPPSFQYPFGAEVWTPISLNERTGTLESAAAVYQVIAVLNRGVAHDRAATELGLLAQGPVRQADVAQSELGVRVTSLREAFVGIARYRTPILVLQFAVIFVLLIASVNLANLLLARNAERRHEFTIRLALGAGPFRLIRQLLAESLLLGLSGAILGLLFASWGLNALRPLMPTRITSFSEIEINLPVLFVTLVVSMVTSLAFGLGPAVIASRQDVQASLKSGGGNVTRNRPGRRISRMLVVTEVALAVVLLAASGLMVRTFLNLTEEDPGFDPSDAVTLSISLPASQYGNREGVVAYFNEALSLIKAIPGVESAGAVTYMPLIGYNPGVDFRIQERGQDTAYRADLQPVSADYFTAMRIPLLRGRQFEESDMRALPETAIINAALATRFWPGEDTIGKQLLLQGTADTRTPLTVIGVVGNVKQFGLHTPPRPEIYLPAYRPSMTVIVRGAGDLSPALRGVVPELDERAAFRLSTLEQVVADSIERRRIFAILLGTLAAVALSLATLGIYGVISYLVAQRTREIGIRMALGARSIKVMGMVVAEGAKLVLAGIAVGLGLAFAATRVMASLLYGVSTTDPITIAGVVLVLTGAGLLASFLPARRATRVDPLVAVRHEQAVY